MSKPKLGPDTEAKISVLLDDLRELETEVAEYIEAKSDKWRDSDAGTDWSAWNEAIVAMIDALESFPLAPGEA
jgi:hypothetical protein